MDIRKIHKSFITDRSSLIVVLFLFLVIRIPLTGEGTPLEFWSSAFIQTGIALFLLYLTQIFGIIRQKTLLPAFFYLLLAGTNPLFFYDLRGSVSAFIVTLCLLFLFNSYQNPLSQRNALNISLILTLGSFNWLPLFLFFPLFWYGMYRFKSLNIRTFFASLTGILLVCLFWFAWCVYENNLSIFLQALPDWSDLTDIQIFSPNIREGVVILFLFLLFVLSGIRIFMAGVSEKIQAMNILSYLYLLACVVFAFFFIQNQWSKEWLLILHIPLSLLIAHYFTLSNKPVELWLFLLVVVFFLLRLGLECFVWIEN
ncbi:MAG: DUF6427 family protein [Dysgonamonadaceae bacterium]|jgi:hypothetical protein|nr:DUF6427 family protein [Dysgonamonadaceae bacterium]